MVDILDGGQECRGPGVEGEKRAISIMSLRGVTQLPTPQPISLVPGSSKICCGRSSVCPAAHQTLLQYKFLCTRSSGGRHPPVNTIRDHGGVAGYEGSCEIQLIQKCCGSKLMMVNLNQRSSEIRKGVFWKLGIQPAKGDIPQLITQIFPK